MTGLELIRKLREESFHHETNEKLESHSYLKAAQEGTLTVAQRQRFAQEQYWIQLSDATSFAYLAGHRGFHPTSLSDTAVPAPVHMKSHEEAEEGGAGKMDLFQFLLGGEIYAAPLLLTYAKTVGLDLGRDATSNYKVSSKAQAYPSYWTRLALTNQRAAAAAACAVNFPAWGDMCRRLLEALGDNKKNSSGDKNGYGYTNVDDEGLAFIKFFATPIDNLDEMAAAIIDQEGTSYEELVEPVRLLQEYEIMFWDAIFDK